MRRLLKARELGLPEGDLSTLEEAPRERARRRLRPQQPRHPRADAAPAATDAAHPPLRGAAAPSCTSASKIRGFLHLYIGEEAIAAGAMPALGPEDAVVATYREHGHALAARRRRCAQSWPRCTASARAAAAAAAARCTSSTPAARFYGGNAIVGGGLPLAVGLALADKLQGRAAVTACFFGEGAVAEGEFHESHEPRRAVAAAGAVRVREQPLRHGHGAGALGVGDRPAPARRAQLPRAGGRRRRHGRGRGRRGRTARRSPPIRAGAGPAVPRDCAPIASAPTRCSTPELYRDRPRSRRWRERGRDPRSRPACKAARRC